MSISSVNSSLASLFLNPYANSAQSTKSTDDSAKSSKSSLTGVVATNSDGDTFQLSSEAQSVRLSASEMFSQMDADGDGALSEEEFTAARPSDVTAEMAANLYNSIDADGSGSLTESEYTTAVNDMPPPPPPPSDSSGSGFSDSSASFDALDTNQDGTISAEELAAARPDDVTEEMAANLFKSLDTDSSGGLTAAEYTAAMGNAAAVSRV
jgi:Ca2+-binding EF-hand superfamily protein